MKYALVTIGVVVAMVLGMAGWSVAGRFLMAKDDVSVLMGITIIAGILGLLAAAVGGGVWWLNRALSQPASLEAPQEKKN